METRRILLDGASTTVVREDDELVAPDGRRMPLDEPVHLPPVTPSKIVCVHLNYESRRAEFGVTLGPAPTYFHKPVSSLNAHGGEIVRPPRCRYLNYEGEIGIVISRRCRHIAPDEAEDYIRGFTIGNDYGLHDFRDTDAGSMLRVKGSDTLCPLGPSLVEGWDFHDKRIRTLVNGEVAQDGNTDEMIWDMHYLVADIARTITLEPGDVLLSGTPANSRPVQPGDVVEVSVDGLGTLRNTIVEGTVAIRRGCRRPAQRERRGHLHDVRRRLGVPRDPRSEEGLTMATVRYLVNEVEASIRFYVDLLGFEVAEDYAPAMAIVRREDLTLWLAGPLASAARPMPDGGQPVPGSWNRFVVTTDDLDALIERLAASGARFRNEVVTGPGGRQILVEDPSGNVVELFQSA